MRKIFTFIGFTSFIIFTNAQIVISEIYSGGGNSGSALKSDYIILKNIGPEKASLNEATIQYAPATGNFNQYHTLPNITLNPGQSFLIQEAANGGGAVDLPSPDFIANEILNFDGASNSSLGLEMAAASGKIVLANNNVQVKDAKSENVVDFAVYGTANSVPVFSSTVNTAFKRVSENPEDNISDFVLATANPINSGNGNIAISDVDINYSKFNFIVNSFVKENNEIAFGAEVENVKVYDEYGQVVMKSPTKTATGLNLIELPKGKYTVTGTINNAPVSQQIVKE
ncbi:hypothetical protein J3D55_004240 [Chryseobacterium ginsenosidimutans]|uniref:T9SS type A sorting domain-containing protein n=1 Tax=Chryseobacterium ginsenosidimutans TaxID=687846 RepID=UPI00216739D6|nr:lamin tail domain-containing protein [Chryseobacterium ginsenosidimutans]MCS3871324.1 hypothetical protein [Chryseobacterium ginsenosidimutans]